MTKPAAATMDVTATQFNVNAYFKHTGAQFSFCNAATAASSAGSWNCGRSGRHAGPWT